MYEAPSIRVVGSVADLTKVINGPRTSPNGPPTQT